MMINRPILPKSQLVKTSSNARGAAKVQLVAVYSNLDLYMLDDGENMRCKADSSTFPH